MAQAVERGSDRSERFQTTALAALLPLLVMRPSLVVIAGATTGLLGLPSRFGLLAVYGVIALAIAGSLLLILRRATHRLWGVIWLVLCAFVISALMASTPVGFRAEIAIDVLTGLGWLAGAFAIRDFGRSRRFLYGASFVILAATGIQLARISSGATETPGYSQYLAYLILPAVLIFADASFESRPALNGSLATLSAVLMLSTGARGPLVVVVIFLFARVILKVRASPRIALLAAAAGIALTWVAVSIRVEVLSGLLGLLERFGLSTRALTFLLEGTLLQDRARDSLIQYTLDIIAQHPIFGVGMANERPLLAERMGASISSDALGWYPHNVILELLAQYGLVAGPLFILLLVGLVFRAVYLTEDPDRRALVLVFVGLGLLPLLFSASYLSWAPFWALVGLCLSGEGRPPTNSRVSLGVGP